MVGKFTVRSLSLSDKQIAFLDGVVSDRYESVDEFGWLMEQEAERRGFPNSWMYRENVLKYINGEIAIFPRAARVFLGVLGDGEEFAFFEEIAKQKLSTER